MELVLHHGIEVLGHRGVTVIVDAALGKDVRHLLPDAALTGTDGADTLQQLSEVVLAKGILSLFQALVIQYEALGHVLLEDACGPDTEVRGPARVDTITHGDDGIEVVKLCWIVLSVCGSCRDFLGN